MLTSRIRGDILAIVSVAMTSTFVAMPVFAEPVSVEEMAGKTDELAVGEKAVTTAQASAEQRRTAVPVSVTPAAVAPAPQKKKVFRALEIPIAATRHHEWNCTGTWCGRQVVLMLGVGY